MFQTSSTQVVSACATPLHINAKAQLAATIHRMSRRMAFQIMGAPLSSVLV
jgi:hypothetical protein